MQTNCGLRANIVVLFLVKIYSLSSILLEQLIVSDLRFFEMPLGVIQNTSRGIYVKKRSETFFVISPPVC